MVKKSKIPILTTKQSQFNSRGSTVFSYINQTTSYISRSSKEGNRIASQGFLWQQLLSEIKLKLVYGEAPAEKKGAIISLY